MTPEQSLNYIEKLKKRGIVPGLGQMQKLMSRLGDPQNSLKNVIHIAGTNGKGSVGAFIEAALLNTGASVGRYSSPAVFSYFEIIRKNGKDIAPQTFAELISKIKDAAEAEDISPSAFEAETAAAFLYFSGCEYCIIEAGLGGRGDSTNVIDTAKTAVITSVSLDHMNILGSTIEEIAAEKCGIFNDKTTVVVSTQTSEAERVIREKAEGLPVIFAQTPENISFSGFKTSFDLGQMKSLEISLLGTFQPFNAAAAVSVLQSLGIAEKHIRNGLKNAVWHGRFDMVSREPLIIADGAHNRQAFYELRKSLEAYFPGKKFIFVAGVLADKDYRAAAKILSPLAEKVYTVTPDNPRALSAQKLAEEFTKCGADADPIDISRIGSIIQNDKITAAFGSLSFLNKFYEAVKE